MAGNGLALALFWRLPIVCATGLAVLLGGLSASRLADDPVGAAALNPLRTDARIDATVSRLNVLGALGDDPARVAGLAELDLYARRTLALAPGDARAYSVLGAVEGLKGDPALARRYYGEALRRAQAEIFALSNRLSERYAAGDFAAAMDDADIIMRRWLRYRGNLVPVLSEMATDAAFAEALLARLAAGPSWRRWLVESMAATPEGLRFVERLLLEEEPGTAGPTEIATVVNGLARSGEYARAYRLFVLTLGDEGRAVSGLVHDGGFKRGFGSTLFEWNLSRISTAEVTIRTEASGEGEAGLRVRFLDAPTHLKNVTQMLHLPAGDYRIGATATARRLVTPRGLFFDVLCAGTFVPLGRLALDPGNYTRATPSVDFAVPPECPAQILTLVTDLQVESFSQQYKGSLVVSNLRIEAVTPTN